MNFQFSEFAANFLQKNVKAKTKNLLRLNVSREFAFFAFFGLEICEAESCSAVKVSKSPLSIER